MPRMRHHSPREADHGVGVGVVDRVGLPPYVAQRGEAFAAEHRGDGGAGGAGFFAGDDAGVDAGQEQSGDVAGGPRVVDGRVVDGQQGVHGVAQPAPVAAATLTVVGFGTGFFEQVGGVGDDGWGAGGCLPAAVGGVGGFVDEQSVGGRHELFVAGPMRVGDVGCADVAGVDLDTGEVGV